MFRFVVFVGLLMFLFPTAVVAGQEVPESVSINLPAEVHPCLSSTPQEVQVLRARYQSEPLAKTTGDRVLEKADKFLSEKPPIPHKGGQWAGWYCCKDCGAKLTTKSPTEHVCPKCGRSYSGYPYDDVAVASQHSKLFAETFNLGLAYVLSAKAPYAQRVREILLEYASFYRDLPLHDYEGHTGDQALARGARIDSQTLSEASFLIDAANAYDLTYNDPCFTPQDRQAIESDLIRPMVATIQRNPWGRLNWQARHNAALASAGFLLHDAKLVDQAINDPKNGFLFQMREGVLPSGMWYEGSIGYHFSSLGSHIVLAEAAIRAGIDLYKLPPYRAMFLAPMELLMPDGTFPPLNDGGRSPITHRRNDYEVAYRRYGDKRFAQYLSPRDSWQALFWGAKEAPSDIAGTIVLPSRGGGEDGLAILREPSGKTALFLDYVKSVSQHTQLVRLHILLYAHGDIRFVDPATFPYGSPLHAAWGRQALAHNTVVVDESSQAPSAGQLKAFATGPDWALARAEAGAAYKDVLLDRTVFMQKNTIVDVVRCAAPKDAIFDLPLHMHGELQGLPQSQPLERLSTKPTYDLLKDVRRFTQPLRRFELDTGEGRRIVVDVFDDSVAYQALGYGQSTLDLVPMVLRRQQGKAATFVAAYQILDKGQQPQEVTSVIGSTVTVSLGQSEIYVGQQQVRVKAGGKSWSSSDATSQDSVAGQ